jgi:hypothetical protein
VPTAKSNIHVMTIIGQIEGHMVLPPQNKTTKYDISCPSSSPSSRTPKSKAAPAPQHGRRRRGGRTGDRRNDRQHE